MQVQSVIETIVVGSLSEVQTSQEKEQWNLMYNEVQMDLIDKEVQESQEKEQRDLMYKEVEESRKRTKGLNVNWCSDISRERTKGLHIQWSSYIWRERTMKLGSSIKRKSKNNEI